MTWQSTSDRPYQAVQALAYLAAVERDRLTVLRLAGRPTVAPSGNTSGAVCPSAAAAAAAPSTSAAAAAAAAAAAPSTAAAAAAAAAALPIAPSIIVAPLSTLRNWASEVRPDTHYSPEILPATSSTLI